MPIVTLKPSGKTVEAAEGSTILEAIIASGEKFTHKCGGEAKCGNCQHLRSRRPQDAEQDPAR